MPVKGLASLSSGILYKSLILYVLFPLTKASSHCGCIEVEELDRRKPSASIFLPRSFSSADKRCNLFCGSKPGDRFAVSSDGICKCYREIDLPTFDCDEMVLPDASVIRVKCVGAELRHKTIFPLPLKTLRRMDVSFTPPSFFEKNQGVTDEGEEEAIRDSVTDNFVSAAVILVLISIACIVLLAIKTWCDNQKKNDEGEENEDCEGKEKKMQTCQSAWSFNEDQVKNSRYEHKISMFS